MPAAVIALEITRLGPGTDAILQAIADRFDLEKIDPHGDTLVQFTVQVAAPRARQAVEQVLDDQGDDAREFVRVRYPS